MVRTVKPNIGKVVVKSIFGTLITIIIFLVLGWFLLTNLAQYSYFAYLVLIPIFLAILSFVIIVGTAMNTTYTISKKYVLKKALFIRESRVVIPLNQVTNVNFSVSWILDRILFKTGSLYIYTAGSNSVDLSIDDVNEVNSLYEIIQDNLKLKKSLKLNEDGEVMETHKETKKVKLLMRVKPDAFLATLARGISAIFSFIFISFYLMLGLLSSLEFFYMILAWFGLFLVIVVIPISLNFYAYKKKYYDFYTDKLEYYDGFLSLNKATIPIERITNVDYYKGIFDRIFGTASIKVETAGSSSAEITIGFVKDSEDIVDYLKEVLKKHGKN